MSNTLPQKMLDKAAQIAVDETRKACEDAGHSLKSLLKQLKSERNWHETKTMKVKGSVDESKLPKGFKVIATSADGVDTEGNNIACETVIMWQEKAVGIRQKARMDAHDLRGDYPAKELKHSGGIDLNRVLTQEELDALCEDLIGEKGKIG